MAQRLGNQVSLLPLPIRTPWGKFHALYSPEGLAELKFPGRRPKGGSPPDQVTQSIDRWHQLTIRALERLFRGESPGQLPPLRPVRGTPFQRRVWSALRRIPLGQTRSYHDIAVSIGRPKASRAVGQACGANPIPLLVPCHRVLAAGNLAGGFSAGLHWKRRLLNTEGVRLG